MSSTRALAGYLSRLQYEDLPEDVVEKGKLSLINSLGNSIGGFPLTVSKTFLELAKELGSGRPESTLIGDGDKVSVAGAAFGNGGLSTMLDHADYFRSESGRCWIWPGALAVPAALAAGEAQGISGKDLIVSAVAGYECSARILTAMDMTLETTKEVLHDLLRANDRRVTIEEIQKRVAAHFNIRTSDMHSARRARSVARPRQVAMYLAKQLTSRSLPELGRKFGGRDHTTVMHAVKRIEELRQTDATLAEDIDLLRRMLEA